MFKINSIQDGCEAILAKHKNVSDKANFTDTEIESGVVVAETDLQRVLLALKDCVWNSAINYE